MSQHFPTSNQQVVEPARRPLRNPNAQRNDTRAAWVVGVGVLLTVTSAIGVATNIGDDPDRDLAGAVWSDELMDDLSQRSEAQLTTLAHQVCTSLESGTPASRIATQLSRSEGLSSASSSAFVRAAVEYTCPEHG